MKAITIRGIDSSISSKLKQVAKNENKSVNQMVLDMIKQNIGMQKGEKYTKKYNDLDHLFGIWTDVNSIKFRVLLTAKEKLTWNYGNETVVD